jgi:hypothetical protein
MNNPEDDGNKEHFKPEAIRDTPFGLLYARLLILLVERNQGELFIELNEQVVPSGTLMHRFEQDGIRFRFVPDKEAH